MRQPLVVHDYGTIGAPVMMLLHGLTEAGTTWPDAVAHWGDAWHQRAVDLRGHGHSPRFTPSEMRIAPEVLMADIVDLLRAEPGPVVLNGHSLGGFVAVGAALAAPDRIRALVLEDPARPTGETRPDPDFVTEQLDFLDRMATPGPEIARARRETTWSDAEIREWATSKALVDRSYIPEGLFLGDGDWVAMMAALTVPTLLVVPEVAHNAADDGVANPLVEIARIRGAGHCVRRDQPAAYFAAVDNFLRARPEFAPTKRRSNSP